MKLFLKEIQDRYIQENFKRVQKMLADVSSAQGDTTYVTNNTLERIPLDGTEDISGTLLPDVASTQDIGSTALPMRGLYSDEVYVGANSLYVDGHKAIGVDPITNRLTYSNDEDADLEVKSRGTGTLYIDSEGDIIISSTGTVTINGDAVANYNIGRDNFDIPSQIINTNQIVLGAIPITNSEMVILNGLILTEGASIDYTIVDNVITFNSGVLTPTGLVSVKYNF